MRCLKKSKVTKTDQYEAHMYGYGRSYSQAAGDIHNSVGDTGIKLIFGCILFVGICGFFAYMIDNQDISKSQYWPTVDGQLLEIGSQSLPMPMVGRFLPLACPYAKYAYTVDGKSYGGQKDAGPCITIIRALTWQAPQKKMPSQEEMRKYFEEEVRKEGTSSQGSDADLSNVLGKSLARSNELHSLMKYDPVKVRFDRSHPESSVLDPDVLQSNKSELYSSVFLMLLGAVLLGGMTMHSYLTKPVADDPSLSLEAALAAQKRRSR